jgi:hypothetical protein
MSGDLVQFPAAAVQRHAGSVDAIADDVDQARGAVGQVAMDTQAYGILCQFLPGLLTPIFALAEEAMQGSAEALRETAANLRTTADQAESTDRAGAGRIKAAGKPTIELPL